MKKRILILIAISFCVTSVALSQSQKSTANTTQIDVVRVYEQVVKEGYGSPMVYEKLANEYYFKNEHIQAKKWFEMLFDSKKVEDETLKFRYKQTLKALKLDKKPNQYLSVSEYH